MIWESVTLMTVIDVLIVAAVLASVCELFRNRRVIARAGITMGGYAIVIGLVAIGLLYFADLFTMYALPLFTSEAAAVAVMEDLHLNHSWWSILFATAFISVGFTMATHKLLTMTNRLQFTQFAMDRASDSIYWMTSDARFFYVNDAACKALGYTRDELLSMSVHDIDPDYSREAWPRFWDEVREQRSFIVKAHHRTKEGRVFPVEIQVNYLQYEGRELNCSIVRDISERKRVEAELREREQQLLQTLEDRDTISQDLHDGILQSLYGVGLQLETFKAQVPEGSRNAGQQIDDVIQQLNALIGEVRDYITGLGSNIFDPVDFRTRAEHLTSTLSETSPVQVQLNIDPAAALHLTRTQTTQLLFILNECLSNSVRHAHPQRVSVNLNCEDGLVCFEVQDDGVGFDAGALHKRGHGLRNIARRAQKVGGRCNVNSKPGQGSRIQVVLPVPVQHSPLPT